MLERFGMLGMSSDESLNEGGMKKFIRLKNDYRHASVTRWLHVFDRAYEVWRRARTDVDQRGSFVRVREDRGEVNPSSRIPTGLPLDAFDPEWYRKQNATWLRSELQIARRRYAFVHDAEFLRYEFSTSYIVLPLMFISQLFGRGGEESVEDGEVTMKRDTRHSVHSEQITYFFSLLC